MKILIAYILYLVGVRGRIAEAVSLRNKLPRDHNLTMLEVSAGKWAGPNANSGDKAQRLEKILLELQDLKDNVDFHMNNFHNAVKEKLIKAKEKVDPTELVHLNEACEEVEDDIRSIQASIKKHCDDMEEYYRSEEHRNIPANVTENINSAKKLIKKFVNDGVETLAEDLKKLAQEFSVTLNEDHAEPAKTQTHEQTSKNDGKRGDVAQPQNTQSLVQTSGENSSAQVRDSVLSTGATAKPGDSLVNNGNESQLNGGITSDNTSGNNFTATTRQKENKTQQNQAGGNNLPDGNIQGNNDHEKQSEAQQATPRNEGGQNSTTGNTYAQETKILQGTDSPKKQTPPVEENKTANSESDESAKATDFSNVPATAITRTVRTYQQNLDREASKLITEIHI
ncbi:uncharacterized protein BXIN_3098 [Babesia sp. Xinjiang]|uniref:uncharacterized protein n=1 Tax=Babesia sp. Xinjiang TaxID=462227 RepID=UPI000A21F4DD|nr:uncharacterized protein BXIN_3098 [Babesia sp. Xinjiang]ORM39416.1 hypothetical protein BXIN_3098 [Babesia sp. Xinjiang]